MGNKYKKISSIAIAIIILIGTLAPFNSNANEIYSYGNWEYVITDGNITIMKYLGNETDITVPVVIDGKKVTEIGNEAFRGNETVESVILPEGIITIGIAAFDHCTKLEHIEIPNSVKAIKRMAFYRCKLTEVNLPSGLTEIGDFVFSHCNNLEHIAIPESVVTIKFSAFAFCNKIESITIPKNVVNIEFCCEEYKSLSNINVDSDNKFFSSKEGVLYNKEQTSLLFYPQAKKGAKFIVPNSVKNIRVAAFAFCTELEEITIPKNVVSIGESAFIKCTHLKYVRLPDSITSIQKNTFYQCTGINSITIPQNVKKIDKQAFANCINLKEVTLPKKLEEIEYASFENCRSLINIAIPESVRKIGRCAFAFCSSLNSITIPTNVRTIESCAFYNCSSLKEVNLSKNLSVIEFKVFSGCTNLEKIVIPKGVNEIGEGAFMLCEKLKTVKFMGKKPAHMGKNIFDDCSREFTILYPRNYESSWAGYTDYPKKSHNDVKIPVSKISLSRKEVILSKGQYYKLKWKITPVDADVKSVTWKCSDKKVATILKKRLVKAKKVGTCIITVITKDGKKKAKCKIRVVEPVEKVRISEKRIYIKKGSKYTLRATIKPRNATIKKVVWSSSNKKVAKVSKGVVTGIKKGTCYITVKSKHAGKKARCKVVVK